MIATEAPRPPLPPFDIDGAVKKVRLAEDAWNTPRPGASVASLYARQCLAQSI